MIVGVVTQFSIAPFMIRMRNLEGSRSRGIGLPASKSLATRVSSLGRGYSMSKTFS